MSWDPDQYDRFAAEREQPFWDLAALIRPTAGAKIADLGCGDGRLTVALHTHLGARSTLGVDSSPEMLARAPEHPGVEFERADIGRWGGTGFDVVFANASLHWVADHAAVLACWRSALADGGQLAVQVPTNADHASHRVARTLAAERWGGTAPPDPVDANVLPPERYAEILDELRASEQHVRLQVYGHHLQSSAAVAEWVKGTSLTRFRSLPDFDDFFVHYSRRLAAELGPQEPYFYAFKRILIWARFASG